MEAGIEQWKGRFKGNGTGTAQERYGRGYEGKG